MFSRAFAEGSRDPGPLWSSRCRRWKLVYLQGPVVFIVNRGESVISEIFKIPDGLEVCGHVDMFDGAAERELGFIEGYTVANDDSAFRPC